MLPLKKQRVSSSFAALLLLSACGEKEPPPATTTGEDVPRVDLLKESEDPNGFALNPRWRSSAPPDILAECNPRAGADSGFVFRTPSCTSQDTLISLNRRPREGVIKQFCGFDDSTSVRGHLNWFPVTYRGVLRWRDFQGGIFLDQDVDLDLFSLEGRGLTAGNALSKAIELEFNSTEVFDRFRNNQWPAGEWKPILSALRSLARGGRREYMDSLAARLDGALTMATGLYGLDGVHSYHAELHPLWALAVRTSGLQAREKWILMVRNMGDEGMCATEQRLPLPLGQNTFSFLLPLRAGADTLRAVGGFARYPGGTSVAPSVTMTPAGVVVSVAVPPAGSPPDKANSAVLFGELELRWLGAGAEITTDLPPLSLAEFPNAPVPGGVARILADEASPEATLRQLVDSLPAATRDSAMRDWHRSVGWIWYLDSPQNPWASAPTFRSTVRVTKGGVQTGPSRDVDFEAIPRDSAGLKRRMTLDSIACKYLKQSIRECNP